MQTNSLRLPAFLIAIWACFFFFFFNWLCCLAYRILFPWLGIEPRAIAVKVLSPNHQTAREVPIWTWVNVNLASGDQTSSLGSARGLQFPCAFSLALSICFLIAIYIFLGYSWSIVLLVSGLQSGDHVYILFFFQILFPYRLLQKKSVVPWAAQ